VIVESLLPSTARGERSRRVAIGTLLLGGPSVPVIAGPHVVDLDFVDHARAAAAAGAAALRGCVYTQRTPREAAAGLGAAGLDLVDEARRLTGLPVIAEPLEVDDVSRLRPHVDALLIGARSMHNTLLLRAAGRSGIPVIVKRAMSATYDELLAAAASVLIEGNDQVVLCERGIRTFETATRNTLDLSAIPVLRERTDLPIIVDPSQAAGRSAWVPALSLAAVAAGADGLLIECHPGGDQGGGDAVRAMTPRNLAGLIRAVDVLVGCAALPRRGGVC
jgi:3-deoxy-7-phosphoheptulonate synthase